MMATYGIKATDVIGWSFWADTYCDEHGSELPETDPEGSERHPIFGSDEWDGYCDRCNRIG